MFCIITFVRIAAGAPPPYAGRVKKPAAHAPNIYFDFFTEFLYSKRQGKSNRHRRRAWNKANVRLVSSYRKRPVMTGRLRCYELLARFA